MGDLRILDKEKVAELKDSIKKAIINSTDIVDWGGDGDTETRLSDFNLDPLYVNINDAIDKVLGLEDDLSKYED